MARAVMLGALCASKSADISYCIFIVFSYCGVPDHNFVFIDAVYAVEKQKFLKRNVR
jgi:hypothetical protein